MIRPTNRLNNKNGKVGRAPSTAQALARLAGLPARSVSNIRQPRPQSLPPRRQTESVAPTVSSAMKTVSCETSLDYDRNNYPNVYSDPETHPWVYFPKNLSRKWSKSCHLPMTFTKRSMERHRKVRSSCWISYPHFHHTGYTPGLKSWPTSCAGSCDHEDYT